MIPTKIYSQRSDLIEKYIGEEIIKNVPVKKKMFFKEFSKAALGGIPWVGGFLGSAANYMDDSEQFIVTELYQNWLEEHSRKMKVLAHTLITIMQRFQQFGEEIEQRLENKIFLNLVSKAFRVWDQADTTEKKDLITKLLTNAATIELCSDNMIRVFIDWINKFNDNHFLIIREIYHHPGIMLAEIHKNINIVKRGDELLDTGLLQMLIHELCNGYVVKFNIPKNEGEYSFKDNNIFDESGNTGILISIDYNKALYELTDAGKQFANYSMDEIIPRIRDIN